MRQRDGVISEAFITCMAVDALDGRGSRGWGRGYYYISLNKKKSVGANNYDNYENTITKVHNESWQW